MFWFLQPFGAKRLPNFSCIQNYSEPGDVADVRGSNSRGGEDGFGMSILSWMTFRSKFKGSSVPWEVAATYPVACPTVGIISKLFPKINTMMYTCIRLRIVEPPNNWWFLQIWCGEVLKRDGSQQEVKFDSITQRLRPLCDGYLDAFSAFEQWTLS